MDNRTHTQRHPCSYCQFVKCPVINKNECPIITTWVRVNRTIQVTNPANSN